jgi:nucleotide-binding universal stress UspA family protein
MGQHILVPVDGSDQSEEALEYALTEIPDPTITLLHVISPIKSSGYGDEDYFDFEGFQQEIEGQRDRAERREAESGRQDGDA